ncbi:DUF4302 domain-containing protein [Chitinophagaceae bacterium LWZ2-11]
MKKNLLYIFSAVIVFSACRKDSPTDFDKTADQRVTEALTAYQKQLTGADYGWKGIIYPAGGGAYGFYFKFNDSNRVKMVSDFDTNTAVTMKESSYRLKALQQPALIFDTYSYVQLLADPNPAVNGGAAGQGLNSDFEFAFNADSTTNDMIVLNGRFNGSRAVLLRASKAEADAYNSGQLGKSFLFNKINTGITNYWKQFTLQGTTYELDAYTFNPAAHRLSISWLNTAGAKQTFSSYYYSTSLGVELLTPFNTGKQIITRFSNFSWDAVASTFNMTVNTSSTATAVALTGAVKSIKIDPAAPKAWRDKAVAAGGYWVNDIGFHINGADNAYNMGSLVNGSSTYYYMLYFPNYTATADMLAPAFLTAARDSLKLDYGYNISNTPIANILQANGTALFTSAAAPTGVLPTSGPFANTLTQFKSPAGYYLVKTSTTSYDMVSATDAKAWISWYWIF